MIGRAGFWRRAVAAAVDLVLTLLLFQALVALLYPASGGRIATGAGISYTTCRPTAVPAGVVLPSGWETAGRQLCTTSLFGLQTRNLFVATRQDGAERGRQFVAPVSPDGSTAVRLLSLDALQVPLFLLLRWVADRAGGGSPGRRLARIAVTDAAGAAAGSALARPLARRYARLAWPILPGSVLMAASAAAGATTGSVPALLAAMAWMAGVALPWVAVLAAAIAIWRHRDTFYDAPSGTAVATRAEIARAVALQPDAPIPAGPGPATDLRRGLLGLRVPWASCALVAAMAAVFAGESWGTRTVTPATLAAWGGADRELALMCWQPYRLLAAVFVHGNIVHLAVNALALLVAGVLLEARLGRILFVAVFLACGLAGALASIAVQAPQMITVGASGAVLGLFAAGFALAWRDPEGRRDWLQAWAVAVCLPALMPGVKLPDGTLVDVADHAGGEAAGLLIGIALVLWWRDGIARRPSRRLALAAGSLAAAGLAATVAIGGIRPPFQTAHLVPPGVAPVDDAGWARRAPALAAAYPEDFRVHFGLAVDAAERGAVAPALAELDRAVALQSKLSPATAGGFRFNMHARVGAGFFGAGDLDAAIAQYDAALAEHPDAFNYRQKGISEFFRGRGGEAVADLRRARVVDRKEPYAILWLSIVAVRTGLEDPIAAIAADADLDTWPGPIVEAYAGALGDDLLAAKAGTLDLVSDEHRTCEVTFYLAERHLMRGETEAARPMLRQAAATCPKTFIEYRAALEELAGHGGLPPD